MHLVGAAISNSEGPTGCGSRCGWRDRFCNDAGTLIEFAWNQTGAAQPGEESEIRTSAAIAAGRGLMRPRTAFAWSVVVICVVLKTASLLLVPADALFFTAAFGIPAVAFTAMGALIITRRPSHPIGWLMLASAIEPIGEFVFDYAAHANSEQGQELAAWLAAWLSPPIPTLSLPFFLLLFPDGRLVSRRWLPVAWLAVGLAVLMPVSSALAPRPITLEGTGRVNPLPLPGRWGEVFQTLQSVGWPVFFLVVAVSTIAVIARLRRSRGLERQQMKWFSFGAGIVGFGMLAAATTDFLVEAEVLGEEGYVVGNLLLVIGFIALGISIAIAVLRYRLYEIDRVISRTVSYVLLVVMLTGIYTGGVFLVQSLLPGEEPGDLAVAASTLAAAALFSSLRRRVQTLVDRRFNRSRYNAQRVVEDFSRRLRDQLDLNDLARELETLASTTVQPATISVWLREGVR